MQILSVKAIGCKELTIIVWHILYYDLIVVHVNTIQVDY